jgi:predicted metal-dependent peptidase
MGIAKHEAKNASLRVVAWDAKNYEVLRAERPSEVARKIASKLKGGGGTVCLPVLQQVYKLMGTGDAVIMLTDGDIFDAQQKETQQYFAKVASKACFSLIGYTRTPIQAPGFNNALINI